MEYIPTIPPNSTYVIYDCFVLFNVRGAAILTLNCVQSLYFGNHIGTFEYKKGIWSDPYPQQTESRKLGTHGPAHTETSIMFILEKVLFK